MNTFKKALKKANLTQQKYTKIRNTPGYFWNKEYKQYENAREEAWKNMSYNDKLDILQLKLERYKLDDNKTKILETQEQIDKLKQERQK
jgi:hypothetical protein